jgi:membrane protein DedA with SNARE-associated domain
MGAVLAATEVAGVGLPLALVLLVPMEAGVPIPIPDDLVMLLVGERVAAGALPWWVGVLALEAVAVAGTALLFFGTRVAGGALTDRVGRRIGLTEDRLAKVTSAVERRGRVALAVGRAAPGLRTITGVAAGGSGLTPRRALPPLLLGATVFAQLHLVLGYALGPVARDLFDAAKGPALLVGLALVAAAAVFWFVRRGRRAGGEAWREAACPACLALGAAGDRLLDTAVGAVRPAPTSRIVRDG